MKMMTQKKTKFWLSVHRPALSESHHDSGLFIFSSFQVSINNSLNNHLVQGDIRRISPLNVCSEIITKSIFFELRKSQIN